MTTTNLCKRRIAILNEDNFGKVQAEGDHKVHVAMGTDNDLVLDTRFNLDFNTAFSSGPARPHGMDQVTRRALMRFVGSNREGH